MVEMKILDVQKVFGIIQESYKNSNFVIFAKYLCFYSFLISIKRITYWEKYWKNKHKR